MNESPYEYDFALSFAGEQRTQVEEVANLLRKQGATVFYDKYEKSALWGKDLFQHLAGIYSKKAKYCIVFASKEYAEKSWTNHELKNAQERAFDQKGREYILPVRFDLTEIPGIPKTAGYLDFNSEGASGIAELAIAKLRDNDLFKPAAPAPSPSPPFGDSSPLVTGSPKSRFLEHLTLGVAAVSSIASVSWLLYHRGFSVLIARSRGVTASVSLIVTLASAAAYSVWRRTKLGSTAQNSHRAIKILLFVVLIGSLGYSTAVLSILSNPTYLSKHLTLAGPEVALLVVNENTGTPLSGASIKVTSAGGETVAEGFSVSNGIARLTLPSRLSSSELTFLVQHENYQDGEFVALPKPGITKRVELLPIPSPPSFRSKLKFSGFPIRVSLNRALTEFNYGYTSIESDRTVIGQHMQITKVRVDLAVLVHSGVVFGNVDVLLGPGPSIFPPGPVKEFRYDNVERKTTRAPVQAHFVIVKKPTRFGQVVHYFATYDFESRQLGGDSTNSSETDEQDFVSPPRISFPNGLFAQVVLWNGSAGGVDEEIKSLSLVVEGTNGGNND